MNQCQIIYGKNQLKCLLGNFSLLSLNSFHSITSDKVLIAKRNLKSYSKTNLIGQKNTVYTQLLST